jgi:hypothetical protein
MIQNPAVEVSGRPLTRKVKQLITKAQSIDQSRQEKVKGVSQLYRHDSNGYTLDRLL